jgi:hypothetical protein
MCGIEYKKELRNMANRQKLAVRVHIPINGKQCLWYEIDEKGNVIWHLSKNEISAQKAVKKMLDNISKCMSNFYSDKPEYIKSI